MEDSYLTGQNIDIGADIDGFFNVPAERSM